MFKVVSLGLAALLGAAALTLGSPAAHAAPQPGPTAAPIEAAIATAPCDPNGTTSSDSALATQLNGQLQADMRGAMTAYRVSCARMVVQAVKQRGLASRAAVIAITTVIVETHLQNYSEEVDHDSLGLFQQRASWGTRAQRLNPTWATNAFLNRMISLYPNSSWMNSPVGQVCQAVQVSAFPSRYQPQAGDAQRIVNALWNANFTNGGVSAVMDGTTLRVFARGADGALWQNYWNGSRWTWQEIGGRITYGPSAIVHNGVLRVFARGTDGALWLATWSGSAWSWQDLGGTITSSPSAIFWGGALRVFARGADGALWQAILGRDTWTWHEVGGGISSAPSAVVHGTTLRVFARGNDGALWQGYTANGANWTWQDLGGGIASAPSAVMHGSTLRVFARGLDGALWQNYWNGSEWAWQDLGGVITCAPGAVMHGTVLRVFARAGDGALWQNYWTGSAWTWQDLGGSIT